MIKKVFTVTVTLLLLLSGSIVVSNAGSDSIEKNYTNLEDDIGMKGRNESDDSGNREFRDTSPKDSSKDERRKKKYEAGVEEASSLNSESEPIDQTGESRIKKSRENIPNDIYSSEEDYNYRDPIRIDGDGDFAVQAENEGWDGDGSADDPYVIENYEIDGGGYGYSLYIGNVTDHFEVRNCYLHNASGEGGEYLRNSGLHLYNTTNGIVRENFVSENMQMGVYLQRSGENVLEENTVLSNGGHGISVEHSSNNEVKDNIVGNENGHEDIIGDKPSIDPRDEDSEIDPGSLLVHVEQPKVSSSKDRERILQNQVDSLARSVDGKTSRIYSSFNMAEIRLEKGVDVRSAVDLLSERDLVVEAEPNYLWEAKDVPNDPGYDSLWSMPTIGAPGAWDLTKGGEDVVIGVIDTGIDYTHPDLKENMWTSEEGNHGYNAVNDTSNPMDDHGHGTHVAGTIGAVGDNEMGIVGTNWNVSLMALKFLDSEGRGTTGDAIACLEYVLERKKEGEKVVATSNSWGGAAQSDLLYRAIEEHQKEGISFIAAAGNDGRDNDLNPSYPANYDLTNIISVAATDRSDELAGFSNYGERTVHVGAPGVDINSTVLDDQYGYMSGTSMAAPHVSGLTALLASRNSSYDQTNYKNVILSSVDPDGDLRSRTLSGGRINASKALRTSPDRDDINFWIHRPDSTVVRGDRTSVIVSLNDGVDPVSGADVSVELNTREETISLKDDGTGKDQVEDDGYYSGGWSPRFAGSVTLTITASYEEEGWQETKKITVEVKGGAGIYLQGSHDNSLSGNTVFNEEHGIFLYSSSTNNLVNNEFLDNDKTALRLYDSTENEIENQTVEGGDSGILLEQSTDNLISENTVSDASKGVSLETSEKNVVDNNTASDNTRAIYLENSYMNSLTNNTLSNNNYGIYLYTSGDNNITQNFLSKNNIGIYLRYSTAAALRDNTMKENGIFISGHRLEDWNSHVIDSTNRVNGKPVYYWKGEEGGSVPEGAGQVILVNCTGVTVEDQNVSRGSGGILAAHSEENVFSNNTASEHDMGGIYLYWSENNTLIDNTASSNTYGIYVFNSDENEFKGNDVSRNEDGFYLEDSSNNLIADNTVTENSGNGIWIDDSVQNEVRGNNVSNNEFRGIDLYQADRSVLDDNFLSDHSIGVDIAESINIKMSNNRMVRDSIYMWGQSLEHWDSHTIDLTNSVNGRPVYYWKNKEGQKIPDGAGQVILVNCTGITVEDQNVSDGSAGILLGFSDGNTVVNNDASNNDKGMRLYESEDNEIRGNIVSDNSNDWFTLSYGIWLSSSNGNRLIDNEASNTDGDGIYIRYSNDNSLVENEALNNHWRGIDISRSESNTIVKSKVLENRLGIRLQYSSGIAIEENEVQNGIELRNSEGITLKKNTMLDEGLSIWGGRKVYWDTHDIDTTNSVDSRPLYYWRDRTGGTVPEGAGQIILANCTDVVVRDQNMSDGRLGIQVGFSSGNVIEQNALSGYDYAVYLRNSDENNLSKNMVSDNDYGLRIYRSNDNRLTQNNASENDRPGIDLWYSDNNTLANNTMLGNRRRGIRLWSSSENTLIQNEGSENSYGVALYDSNDNLLKENELLKNRDGIYLSDSGKNSLMRNTASNNSDSGIELEGSSENRISENIVLSNDYGVSIEASDNNTFVANNVSKNEEYGFHFVESLENVVYNNWFIENEEQAFDDGENTWDGGDPGRGGEGGNYWSDYEGRDRGDRIGDEPYNITGNESRDRYPWMNFEMIHPVGNFDVSVGDITAGDEPVVKVSEVEDVHGNALEGRYEVDVVLDSGHIDEDLSLEDEKAEYTLPELTDAGEYTVEVIIEDVIESDDFHVETAALDYIEIGPAGKTITAGKTIDFDAFAYDEFDNGIGYVTEETNWAIDEKAGGNWTGSEYRAEFAGTWIVTGSYEDVSKDRVNLTVEPGPLDHVKIEPEEDQTISPGENIDFSAGAYDRYGNLITDEESEFTWENTTSRGLFGKIEAGGYNVTATYEDVSSEPTTVIVEEKEEDNVVLFPYLSLIVGVLLSLIIYKRKKKVGQR